MSLVQRLNISITIWFTVVILMILLVSSAVRAQYVNHYPRVPVNLGGSYDEVDPFKNKQVNKYFGSIPKQNVGEKPILEEGVKYLVARNEKEVFSNMNVNFSAEAKYGLAKASGRYNKYVQNFKHEKSFSIVLSARRIWVAESIDEIYLTKRGKKALQRWNKKKKLYQFRELAGSHIVTDIYKGVSVDAIYTFYSSDVETLKQVEKDFDAEYKSNKISASFFSTLRNKYNNLRIEFDAKQKGGINKFPTVTDVLKVNQDNLKEILKVLHSVLDKMDEDTAVTFGFNVLPIDQIDDVRSRIHPSWSTVSALYATFVSENKKLYYDYFRLLNLINLLESVKNNTPRNLYVQGGREGLIEKIKELQIKEKEILSHFKKINSDTRFNDFLGKTTGYNLNLDLGNFSLKDYLNIPFGEFLGWNSSDFRVWWDGSTRDGHRHFEKSWSLTIEFKHPKLITKADLYVNGLKKKSWKKSSLETGKIVYTDKNQWKNVWTHHHNLVERVKGEILAGRKRHRSKDRYVFVIQTIDLETHIFPVENDYGYKPEPEEVDLVKKLSQFKAD